MCKKQRMILEKRSSSKFVFSKNVDIFRNTDKNFLKVYLAVHNFSTAEWSWVLKTIVTLVNYSDFVMLQWGSGAI